MSIDSHYILLVSFRFLGNEPHHVLEDIYLAKQYHGQDGIGGYLYGYNVPDIAKTERKKAGGNLRGAYNYIAGNGQEIKVKSNKYLYILKKAPLNEYKIVSFVYDMNYHLKNQ